MAKITKIEVQKKDKNRCNLYLDGEFFAGVSLEIVIKEGLKEGKELYKKKLGDIIFTSEKEKALKKAIDYISKALKKTSNTKSSPEKHNRNKKNDTLMCRFCLHCNMFIFHFSHNKVLVLSNLIFLRTVLINNVVRMRF